MTMNLPAIRAIYKFEMARWGRTFLQSIVSPVIATSLYFACIANGNSRMFHSADFRALVQKAGLVIEHESHDKGTAHSLLRCRAG